MSCRRRLLERTLEHLTCCSTAENLRDEIDAELERPDPEDQLQLALHDLVNAVELNDLPAEELGEPRWKEIVKLSGWADPQ